ncbi:putative lipopolysaccharide biosynthesis O-acetyl transferase WbbJ [Sporotomaculum syntrophicum]|uniref:Lipopolysaccharide biosynthesis O-acetyl transferase WbbJ n=1 Tax=Sporotomaculum syntrophicum TaxID=182264 RepID=A0A9D2WPL7_9FIRM|nr:gamma carbonic anhydrase family protein [Sporotomaculum syntrophicum]KAF1085292.1 putative lipopolysaccharide biosynthesis O-acetyl transferase WbbJ [Sporotomaculum syntrophicum]
MLYSFDGKQPVIGKDTYVSEQALVIGDVKIGDNCYIGHGAILRGDYGTIEIGSGTAVEEGVVVHAPPKETCKIGKKVTIGHGAVVHAAEVGDFVVLGMGSVTSIRSVIGAGTIVAEGAVVKMRQVIPEKIVVAGNPACKVREVKEKDTELWNYGKQLYIDLAKKYLDIGMQLIPTNNK